MLARSTIKRAAKRALTATNLSVIRSSRLDRIERDALLGEKALMLSIFPDQDVPIALKHLAQSKSQINQDIFALIHSGWKHGGYFVEFGATDGQTLSNTWLLEKAFGWTGILAEPARVWRHALEGAGRTATLEFDCVWSETGKTLEFEEADWSELSTVTEFRGSDKHVRHGVRKYSVQTVSLNDLLVRHGAPAEMDFLSIDTEGSEFSILSSLDFDRFRFRTIACEHNHGPTRERIHGLLRGHGYTRVYTDETKFDDWYVLGA